MLTRGSRINNFFLGCSILTIAIAFSPSVGCQRKQSATAPVHGKVLLNGQPLATGAVITSSTSGRGAQGVIKNGEFTLGTFTADDGALVGTHQVAVTANEVRPGSGPESSPGKSLIPARYNNPATSELIIEVKQGDNNPELSLTSP